MTQFTRRLSLIGAALGIILGLSLSHASSILASDAGMVLPMSVKRCNESRVFDRSGTLLYDSSQKLSRMGTAYPLFLSEVLRTYTTDLSCAGLLISTSFDLSLQQKLAQELLPFLSKHPTSSYSTVVCDASKGELLAVVTLGSEITNWQDREATVELAVNGQNAQVPLMELIKASCGSASFTTSLSQGATLLYQKPQALPVVEKVKRHSLIVRSKETTAVYLSVSSSALSTVTITTDSELSSPQTNLEILHIIDAITAAHKNEGR